MNPAENYSKMVKVRICPVCGGFVCPYCEPNTKERTMQVPNQLKETIDTARMLLELIKNDDVKKSLDLLKEVVKLLGEVKKDGQITIDDIDVVLDFILTKLPPKFKAGNEKALKEAVRHIILGLMQLKTYNASLGAPKA